MDSIVIEFIQAHIEDDPKKLLLSAQRYPQVDVRFAAIQIEARQRIKEKLPLWFAVPELIFPSILACQQASSQATARYKARFVQEGESVIDATGGLGVDCASLAEKAEQIIYIEQDKQICVTAEHNFKALTLPHIDVRYGSCTDLLPTLPSVDLIYIDPSRRNAQQRRLFALSDCTPDITAIQEGLLQKAKRVLVKISPMADIWQTLRLLPQTTEVHVLSVKNECKELLFLLEKPKNPTSIHTLPIICTDIDREGHDTQITFTLHQEATATALILDKTPEGYLYEPNASLLKAGAFKYLSQHYGIQKLSPHTHLYASPTLHASFPGRIFNIIRVLDFSKLTIKNLHLSIPQANMAVRNFCMEAEALRKRLKIKEGGDVYLFGVTLYDNNYALILATKKN